MQCKFFMFACYTDQRRLKSSSTQNNMAGEKAHMQEARNLIASKRLSLDNSISKVSVVQFFFSSITATSTNAKRIRQGADKNGTSNQVYLVVAYFVVYRKTDMCNVQSIYTLLHNQDTKANVQPIRTRARTSIESVAQQLFQVVKDHNNQIVLEMVQGFKPVLHCQLQIDICRRRKRSARTCNRLAATTSNIAISHYRYKHHPI